jgi:transposase
MQGLHSFDPLAETVICLESFVPKGHLLRKVDRVVNLSFVRKLTAPCYAEGLGRPSIDPEIYFRIQLVAYLYGIPSERRLCDDIYCNLAYRWFCRLSPDDDVPDHSSLTTIRDRLGEEIFAAVFGEIVRLCKKKGLVDENCRVMTDATLIAADAALDSLVHNDPEQARQETEAMHGRTKSIDPPATRKISNQTHTSHTDPDSTLAQKRGTPRQLKYKVHQTIDAESRVILDTEVTTGARHDNQPYLEQLQRVRDRHKIRIREVIADRGYGSAAIIRAVQQQGIEATIPLWSGRVGNSKYFSAGLFYEKEHDRFRCSEGKYLKPNPAISENHKRYVSSSADCRECPQASTCPARVKNKSAQRFVMRSLDQDLFEEVQARMRDPIFGEKMSERMWKIEGLFAEAKQNHNLSRAKYRGRSKVQIQVYLSAIAQNLKRLVALFYYWLIACRSANKSNKPIYST